MIDIEAYLHDKPGHPIDEDAAEYFRAAFESLNTSFSTENSYIESVEEDEEGVCLSIVYITPYMSSDMGDRSHLANVFRLADSVGIVPTRDEDGFIATIVFTFALWN